MGFTYNPASAAFGNSTLKFSFFNFYLTNLLTDDDFTKVIAKMRDVTEEKNKNPLGREHAFAYSSILTFWSVFLEIEPIMWRALAINTCVLFVLTAFFLKSLFVASVCVVVCSMI